jgi:hypothetical protein
MKKANPLFHVIAALVIGSLALSACMPRGVRLGGIVKGVVYADLNGNGAIEAGEGPLDGAAVSLADCGPALSQTTGADGAFNFTNLPEGTCHVSVAKAGWTYTGSFPSLGYPVPVASNPDLPTAFSMFLAPPPGYSPTATDTPVPAGPTDTPMPTVAPTSSVPMVSALDKDVNCRFGPSTKFASVGFLKVGVEVPIHGTNESHDWWQIQNPQEAAGNFCWLGGSVTRTSGDISHLAIFPIPLAFVTDVSVTLTPVIHGFCGGPNPQWFTAHVTTNGPTNVTYHLEIYNADNSLRNKTSDASLVFASASTQDFDPGGAYKTDCGSFYIKLIVTSPNSMTGAAKWKVVEP